ncbi:hypothetical protein SAMN05428959_101274 [Duganella sp. CF517]|uniref:hypothetical protein n=1 Tax=Duganella sp. CF517 TaxID=1881038 RepID=UPI0008C86EC4|nr:hypothetical protein [Duganella sp. CF517]SEN11859.1 hypothetical protein SAMN05428959_101274 [Duganella sp. CF517]
MRSIYTVLLACSLPCAVHAADWHPFRWYMASIGGGPVERAAMLLPVKVNGIDCQVQLDTGVRDALIWSRPAPPSGTAPGETRTALIELAGIRTHVPAQPANLSPLTAETCSAGPIATVGNAFFEHGTLTLDLGGARFAFEAAPTLAGEPAAQSMRYTRWREGGGAPLVEVKRPGGKTGYALLDTGSARFGLVATSADAWADLSGGLALAAGPQVKTMSVQSWGRQLPCYETALAGGFDAGGAPGLQATVSYCVEQEFHFAVKVIGVLGLRPLGDRVIALDYLSNRWRLSEAAPRPASAGL